MLETLRKADELQAYFMTDSSTWVIGKRGLPNLVVLLKGDPSLINIYHGLCQPDDVRGQTSGKQFLEFVASEEGQRTVRLFGQDQYGEPLYRDALQVQRFAK